MCAVGRYKLADYASKRQFKFESLQALIHTFDEGLKNGALLPSTTAAARRLWATMHGAVNLELKNCHLKAKRANELFDAARNAVLKSLQNF